jgi:two-component system, chemotaxis family, response regulator Rcp1
VHILLVEDNEGDIVLTMETLGDMRLSNTVSVARDGEEALRILKQLPSVDHNARPGLILLDINLPRVDGKEILQFLQQHSSLSSIPVIMLTTSSSQKDMEDCVKLGAKGYVIKPLDTEKFIKAIAGTGLFTLSLQSTPQ